MRACTTTTVVLAYYEVNSFIVLNLKHTMSTINASTIDAG